ncbi:hypothetical protein DRP77_08715 [Candidatus Poribacteria bacterium]|nr:MAG: hypothetical protein DRP77_08715 [Candidatus Poribacteria bacterium]
MTFSDHIRSLPTAVGVVFNPASKPVAALKGDEVYVLSSDSPWLERLGTADVKELSLKELEEVTCLHPLSYKEMPLVVDGSLSRGETGFFTISPSHVEADFDIASRHQLDLSCSLDEGGRLSEEMGLLASYRAEAIEGRIAEMLRSNGHLLGLLPRKEEIKICPECGARMSFRPIKEWAVRTPDGEEVGISSEKAWGVPMAALYCPRCGELSISEEAEERIREIINRRGVESWYKVRAEEVVEEARCGRCNSTRLKREDQVLDPVFAAAANFVKKLDSLNGKSSQVLIVAEPEEQLERWLKLVKAMIGEVTPEDGVMALPIRGGRPNRLELKGLGEREPDLARLMILMEPEGEGVRRLEEEFKAARKVLEEMAELAVEREELPLDSLAASALDKLAGEVMLSYERLEPAEGAARLIGFHLKDLSVLYLPWARRRGAPMWMVEDLLKLWAPLTPFTSERIWRKLRPGTRSIFLEPAPLGTLRDWEGERIWWQLVEIKLEMDRIGGRRWRVIVPSPELLEKLLPYKQALEEIGGGEVVISLQGGADRVYVEGG